MTVTESHRHTWMALFRVQSSDCLSHAQFSTLSLYVRSNNPLFSILQRVTGAARWGLTVCLLYSSSAASELRGPLMTCCYREQCERRSCLDLGVIPHFVWWLQCLPADAWSVY